MLECKEDIEKLRYGMKENEMVRSIISSKNKSDFLYSINVIEKYPEILNNPKISTGDFVRIHQAALKYSKIVDLNLVNRIYKDKNWDINERNFF